MCTGTVYLEVMLIKNGLCSRGRFTQWNVYIGEKIKACLLTYSVTLSTRANKQARIAHSFRYLCHVCQRIRK